MQGTEVAGAEKTLMETFIRQKMHSVQITYILQIDCAEERTGKSCSPNVMKHLGIFRAKLPLFLS